MAKETVSVGKHYLAISLAALFFFIFSSLLGVFGLLPHDIQQVVQPNPIQLFGSNGADFGAPVATTSNAGDEAAEEPAVQYARGVVKETPLHISIPKIGVDVAVKNPTSVNVNLLDAALMQGAVRYPTSGLLGESKNVFLFGHSAYSRVIRNKAYHTFDGVEKLVPEDEIYVDGSDARYVYKVVRVSFLKDADAYIDLDSDVRMLTLSTCNAFGAKDDRVVVQARFVQKTTIPAVY